MIFASPKEKERIRLKKMQRYVPGESTIMGQTLQFVDACTFLGGYEHIFEKDIYSFKAKNDTPYILDCGANIGLSVLFFNKLYPNATVVGFEPDPQIFKALENNVRAYGCKKTTLVNKAIWTTNEHISFQVEGGFSGRIPKEGDLTNIINVPCARLRDYLAEKVDFLKIDIEGAELDVLLDCADRLENVENIFIEYHSHIHESQSLHTILELLNANGFRYHLHEAFTRPKPYVDSELMLGMDLQLDIFGYRTH